MNYIRRWLNIKRPNAQAKAAGLELLDSMRTSMDEYQVQMNAALKRFSDAWIEARSEIKDKNTARWFYAGALYPEDIGMPILDPFTWLPTYKPYQAIGSVYGIPIEFDTTLPKGVMELRSDGRVLKVFEVKHDE